MILFSPLPQRILYGEAASSSDIAVTSEIMYSGSAELTREVPSY